MKNLLTLLFLAAAAFGQTVNPNYVPSVGAAVTPTIISVNPTIGAACSSYQAPAYNWTTGELFGCANGAIKRLSTPASDYRVTGAAQLPAWRLKLANVANSVSDARVLFVGDSTTWGAYSANFPSNPTSSGWPALLSKLFPSIEPVSNASLTAQANGNSDSRVTLSGAWTRSNVGAGFGHGCFSVNGAGNLVFTPGDGVTYDSFTIYTQGGQGGGVISATATGGSAANITVPFSNTPVVTTVTAAAASSSNSVTVAWVSGTSVQVIGIEAFNSAVQRIRFANAGFSGASSSAWVDNFTSITAIKAWAPDLTVVMLGINDAQNSYPAPSYLANISTLIATARLSGDVIVMSSVPSDPSLTSVVALEAAYASGLAGLAASNNVVFVDLFNRFSGQFQTNLMTNTLHPNPAGYFDIARFVYSYLN